MGNSQTKESHDHQYPSGSSRDYRNRRASRTDLGILGLPGTSRHRDDADAPFVHKETRAEREARKREKENALRLKERERSLREEHIDGGYLVTLGVYVGTEDYSKAVVRQLMIERKMAPFWRGLNDWSGTWAEHQLIAAARGLRIPAADETPDPDLVPMPRPRATSASDAQNLMVPMGPRTMSAASDRSGSGTATPSGGSGRNIKPRAKAFAAALSMGGSRNNSTTDLAGREIKLPDDPFVNGQPLEVYLYKNADECPICFLTYPPYLNRTRCCDQPICSECFVQIKRADPHPPEHHPDGQARDPNESLNADDPPEMLTSEPAACPYCQQIEFGVTYEPPPFRRGLAYSMSSLQVASPAMSSQTSLSSSGPPTTVSPAGRRRTHSLSATAPGVITTDRVRPDWSTKLAAVRAHQARRAAAATALHTAAFMHHDSRSILRPGRFSRRNTGNVGGSGTPGSNEQAADSNQEGGAQAAEGDDGQGGRSARRTRMDELEDMMFMEAVRLSIAAEEERQRKEEKVAKKEAKKREKEEKKATKKAGRDPYSGGVSGASASSLSLGFGRKRGNSAASNLRVEATVQGASQASSEAPQDQDKSDDKGKGVDRGDESGSASSSAPAPIPPRLNSHLRQMSNASSLGSSLADTPTGSYTGEGYLGKQASQGDDSDRETGTEPLFNYRSLAEIVGVDIDSGMAREVEEEGESPDPTPGRTLPQVREEKEGEAEAEHVEAAVAPKPTLVITERAVKSEKTAPASQERVVTPPPEVTITPNTPAADADADDKRLGHSTNVVEHTTDEIHR